MQQQVMIHVCFVSRFYNNELIIKAKIQKIYTCIIYPASPSRILLTVGFSEKKKKNKTKQNKTKQNKKKKNKKKKKVCSWCQEWEYTTEQNIVLDWLRP